MCWMCPKLCTSISDTFSKIFGKKLTPSPMIVLFVMAQTDTHFEMWETTMFAFCLLLARRPILLKWKDPVPPTYSHWVREVMHYIKLENIRYTIRGSTRKFCNVWQPFLMEADNIVLWTSVAVLSLCYFVYFIIPFFFSPSFCLVMWTLSETTVFYTISTVNLITVILLFC